MVARVGPTYLADHMLKNGLIPESSLDHVYLSKNIEDAITVKKLINSVTDHVPVLTSLNIDIKKDRSKFKRKVTKRSLKIFSVEAWNESLTKKNWVIINECTEVDYMVAIFNKNIEDALDEVAPVKTFLIRSQYKFGLSVDTKELMHKRDVTRGSIKNASSLAERMVLQTKYKVLRNKVTRNIREGNRLQ